MHKLDPVSPRWREKRKRKREKERERALKGGRRTPAALSHDVGEPCIMSWPHYLSTTICLLLPVSPCHSSYLAPSLSLSIPSFIPVYISLSYKYSFAFLSSRADVFMRLFTHERERETSKEKKKRLEERKREEREGEEREEEEAEEWS